MNPPAPSLDAIPEKLLESLGSQIDLLFTLSVAVCGGIIALVFQIAIHNRSDGTTRPIKIHWPWALLLALVAEGISLLCGYFARGAITANIPSIYRIDFSDPTIKTFGRATAFDGYGMLAGLITWQFIAFAVGLSLLFVLTFTNRKLI